MDENDFPSWIGVAEQDLASARHLLGLNPRPVEVICFLCQQSAEKALKSILVAEERPVPRTHDLVALVQSLFEGYPVLRELIPACVRLSTYAVTTRYPYPGQLPDNAEETAIADAEHAMSLVKSLKIQA